MGSPVAPAQLHAQFHEDVVHLTRAQRKALAVTSGADEEGRVVRSGYAREVAHPAIPAQGVHCARVHWYLTRLAELGLVDAQHPGLEIDVHVAQ